MKLETPITLSKAAEILGCPFLGDPNHPITGVNEIHRVTQGDVTFVDVEKYYKKALTSAATTIIINKEVAVPEGKGLLVSDDPFRDYNRFSTYFRPRPALDLTGGESAFLGVKLGKGVVLGENVQLAQGVEIGHNSVIGSNVTIGENTLIYPNVTIYDNTIIGANCCIQAGTVIGSEAFYYKNRPDRRDKMISVGHVEIQDFVEIGANCTIDRGVSDVTRIGAHTKIDNLVQVGHDTLIGRKCLIAAQVGIAGCVTLEDEVMLWGQVGVVQDTVIGKGANLLGKAGVMSDLPGGKSYGGIVADDARNFLKKEAILKRLIEIMPDIEHMIGQSK